MIKCRNRVLPQQRLLGHERAKIARDGPHVAVRQLVPGPREGVREFLRIAHEAPRNLLVSRIHPHREVGRRHHRGVPRRRIVGIRHGARCGGVRGSPLLRTGRALRQLPLIAEQVFKVVVVPLYWVGGPCAFQAAANGVSAFAAAKGILPAETLLLDGGTLGCGSDIFAWVGRAVGFAECMTASDQSNGFLVVHRHASECLADVSCRSDWIRLAIGALRVHVYQAHLDGAEGALELTITAVALVSQPLALRPPVNVFFRFPNVLATAGEAVGLEPHRFQGDVAS